MIITISGKPGSGKSTMARMIAEKYKLKYYSTGDFFRAKAKEKNLSLKEFSTLSEKEREHDNDTDRWQTELGKKEDNFVMEGRLGHKFIEKAIKIYLDVDKETGALRIMNEKREGEMMLDKTHAISLWEHRVASEHERYSNYYDVNIHDHSQYDFVVDTSSLTRQEVFEKICEFVDGVKK